MPPSTKSADAKAKPGVARRAARSFRPYTFRVTGIGLLILITAGLGVVNPYLLRAVFDDALFPQIGSQTGPPDIELLWILAGIMAGATVVSGALGIVQTWATNIVGQRVMRDLRDRLYTHLQSLSLGFFTGARTGEIQSRIANDVGGIQNVVTNTMSWSSGVRRRFRRCARRSRSARTAHAPSRHRERRSARRAPAAAAGRA